MPKVNKFKLTKTKSGVISAATKQEFMQFPCEQCKLKFLSKEDLIKHADKHEGGIKHPCDFCDQRFTQAATWSSHIRTCHKDAKVFCCTKCDYGANLKRTLTRHMRSHTGEKNYKCTVCNAAFGEKLYLTRHIRIHTGEKPYQCDICGASFSQLQTLKMHTMRHTGEACICKHCGSAYTNESLLDKHIQKYHKQLEKPLQCPKCEKKFTDSIKFKKHVKKHDWIRMHNCDHCSFRSPKISEITSHKYTVHKDVFRFKCYQCVSRRFESEELLRRHSQLFHGNAYKADGVGYNCPVCAVNITTKERFEHHMGRHIEKGQFSYEEEMIITNGKNSKPKAKPTEKITELKDSRELFKCEKCLKTFMDPKKLKMHVRTHDTVYIRKCGRCPFSSALRGEITSHWYSVHGDLFRFKCDQCVRRRFESEERLQRHRHLFHTDAYRVDGAAYRCPVCRHTLESKRNFEAHVERHVESDEFPNEMIVTNGDVSESTRKVKKSKEIVKLVKCGKCFKSLMGSKSLKRHEKRLHSHPEILNLKCRFCPFTTGSNRENQMHLRKDHSKLLVFKCVRCNKKRYPTKNELNVHTNLYHNGVYDTEEGNFACPKCEHVLTSKPEFETHALVHHDSYLGKVKKCAKKKIGIPLEMLVYDVGDEAAVKIELKEQVVEEGEIFDYEMS